MRYVQLLIFGLMCCVLIGCTGQKRKPLPDNLLELSNLVYPEEVEKVADLDILVERRNKQLTLVNRTPRVFNDVQIWLNHEYVGLASTIQIGPKNKFDLGQFVNYHRQRYPVAGFLSPDKAFPVVLAEIYDPATNTRYRMIVTKDESIQILR